jgi:3-oxoacyl-[acyl-carrier protein] reductase
MDLDLAGKKALVTGGSRGVGRGIVLSLARAGVDVVTCYRQESELVESLVRELKEIGGDHQVVQADVTSAADVERLVAACGERLDILVNNAGAISHIPFAELSLEEWHRIVDTDLTATFLVTQKALPLLASGGSVVNVGSKVATVGIPLRAHYTAAKAGLVGLTRSLAKEYGSKGIRFNIVAPGPVQTETETPEPVKERYRTMIPLGRLGTTEDIANVVLFLASPRAAFVTGETVNVDGGL